MKIKSYFLKRSLKKKTTKKEVDTDIRYHLKDSLSSQATEASSLISEQTEIRFTQHSIETNKTILHAEKPETNNQKEPSASSFWSKLLCFAQEYDPTTTELPITVSAASPHDGQTVTSPKEAIECIYETELNLAMPSLTDSSISNIGRSLSLEMDESSWNTKKKGQQTTTTCSSHDLPLPPLDPKVWPQGPLLLRPKPNSGTKILGIRRDASDQYLWSPSSSNKAWWETLEEEWNQTETKAENNLELPISHNHDILPINNGNEAEGESLVTDFESELFRGSLLLRLRYAEGTTCDPSDDTKGFFAGVPFRYQAIIRGTFKTDLPWLDLMTGTRLERKPSKLPAKWILWTALKVVRFFAPQLRTRLDCDKPYSISPLGSAPRTIHVTEGKATDLMGDDREEPTIPEESLTGKVYVIKDPLERARARKRHFDKIFVSNKKQQGESLMTGDKTYTFQFLQHLLDYQKASIDLGNFNYDMRDLLNGQPLQLMAEHGDKRLWDFEMWNDLILEDAINYINQEQ